ncbi:MAG: ISAzo13 family transposase, partial [Treponema sp.]|nr:ISAzo13 family transposase [Treponema sp.]
INLIANTKTRGGLKIMAGLDTGHYETGKKVSDEELRKIKLKQSSFHGDWNYSISPYI